MKNLKRSVVMLAVLAAMSSVHGAYGQSGQERTSSAQSSPNSGIRVESAAKPREVLGGVPVEPSSTANRAAEPQGHSSGLAEKQSFPARRAEDLPARRDGEPQDLINACSSAAEELKASRRLIDLLDRENAMLRERLDTEKKTNALLAELNETRKSEGDALRNTVAAKDETIRAKTEVIASQARLIETLKTKKSSPWKRLGDVLIGIAAGMVLR